MLKFCRSLTLAGMLVLAACGGDEADAKGDAKGSSLSGAGRIAGEPSQEPGTADADDSAEAESQAQQESEGSSSEPSSVEDSVVVADDAESATSPTSIAETADTADTTDESGATSQPAQAADEAPTTTVLEEAEPAFSTTTAPISPDVTAAPGSGEGEVEPGSGTPDLDEAIEEVGFENPCDIFGNGELDDVVNAAAATSGVFDDLPAGLGAGPVAFDVASESPNACEWFSDPFIWFVGVSWEAADPTFVNTVLEGQSLTGVGYEAAITSDTSAQMVVGDLFVTVTNLVPGNTSMSSDRQVTEAIVAAVADRLL